MGVAWETDVICFSLGRQKHEAELDELVGAWCAGKDAAAEAADLGARGVCSPGGEVISIQPCVSSI